MGRDSSEVSSPKFLDPLEAFSKLLDIARCAVLVDSDNDFSPPVFNNSQTVFSSNRKSIDGGSDVAAEDSLYTL